METAAVEPPPSHNTGTPNATSGRSSSARSGPAHLASTSAGAPSTRSARAAQKGGPPARGGPPSTRSRERFPTTASRGTPRIYPRPEPGRDQREPERGREARQRCRPARVAGVQVVDQRRPPVRSDRREPLVESESREPAD